MEYDSVDTTPKLASLPPVKIPLMMILMMKKNMKQLSGVHRIITHDFNSTIILLLICFRLALKTST